MSQSGVPANRSRNWPIALELRPAVNALALSERASDVVISVPRSVFVEPPGGLALGVSPELEPPPPQPETHSVATVHATRHVIRKPRDARCSLRIEPPRPDSLRKAQGGV